MVFIYTAALAGETAELSNLALDHTAEPKTVLEERAGILVGMQLRRGVLLLQRLQQSQRKPGIDKSRRLIHPILVASSSISAG